MRKALCYIIVFLMPITLSVMFFRKAAGNEEFGSFSIVYDYLQLYPVESINDVKILFTDFEQILFENTDFEPDWSGNIWSDIQELAEVVVEGFTLLFNFLKWPVLLLMQVLKFLWQSLSWIFNFPYYVLQN